jgi:hypothetical protein
MVLTVFSPDRMKSRRRATGQKKSPVKKPPGCRIPPQFRPTPYEPGEKDSIERRAGLLASGSSRTPGLPIMRQWHSSGFGRRLQRRIRSGFSPLSLALSGAFPCIKYKIMRGERKFKKIRKTLEKLTLLTRKNITFQ